MKLFFRFCIDTLTNPLKQGISRNFKPRRKFTSQGNFSRPREKKARQAGDQHAKNHSLETLGDERKSKAKQQGKASIQAKDKGRYIGSKSIPLHEVKHQRVRHVGSFMLVASLWLCLAHHAMARWLARCSRC